MGKGRRRGSVGEVREREGEVSVGVWSGLRGGEGEGEVVGGGVVWVVVGRGRWKGRKCEGQRWGG